MDADEVAQQGTALVALRVGCLRIGPAGDDHVRARARDDAAAAEAEAAPVNQFQVEVTGLGVDLLDASAGACSNPG
jgi:hypothetical protein